MPILVKKTSILSKTQCSHVLFFSNFSWKTPAVVHMIGQKTSILSKLHSILGQKSHRMPFFPISHEKVSALMSIFCQKNVHSQKRNSSHLHVLSKKTSTLLKTNCSHVFLFLIFHKLPILSCRYFVKKRQFCQNYNTWWAIKVHKMPFFSNSSWNNRCSHTHILSQVRLFSKEHTVLKFMFYEKTSVLLKSMCSHVIFFQVFNEKPPAVKPIYGQKISNLSKLHYFWRKRQ